MAMTVLSTIVVVAALVSVAATGAASAARIDVVPSSDLQAVLNGASDGDTVTLAPGIIAGRSGSSVSSP